MYSKNNFKLGQEIDLVAYSYDDRGTEYLKTVNGKIYQITDDFIVVDNGYFKESYKYEEFSPSVPYCTNGEPYDLSLQSYSDDVVDNCIEDLEKRGMGFVFNKEQLEKATKILKEKNISSEICFKENGSIYLKKINKF